eukprot:CAMPEP_0116071026 /NCGR_PEP_ID=MMETSP0322-20121206/13462_1 /TAXON_ID=163516 /ORGANISM="Leptocylindrus danicus var. apora, Strain B651" /LENGTH=74 /DNA_ID=CAMNT_0003559151 /DNA_START=42 /DNA_END=263 /DNA_ORIENTATION=+
MIKIHQTLLTFLLYKPITTTYSQTLTPSSFVPTSTPSATPSSSPSSSSSSSSSSYVDSECEDYPNWVDGDEDGC